MHLILRDAAWRPLLRMTFNRTTVSPVILRRERKRASKDDGPPLVPRILRGAQRARTSG
jgi:hypothetical protein